MLWIPGQRTLIAGDVLFNDMHVYTAETDSEARRKMVELITENQRIKNLRLLFLDIARLERPLTRVRP